MNSKTKRTLALVDELAGVPDQRATWPRLLVPSESFGFMLAHALLGCNEPGPTRTEYAGLVFQMDYRFRR